MGIYDGKLQIHRKTGNHQLLTNFNLKDPSYGDEPPCERFAKAEKMLGSDSSATVENLEKILSMTHQNDLTVYSNIYDLKSGEVYIYNRADFTRKVKFNLSNELKKGKHVVSIPSLFK